MEQIPFISSAPNTLGIELELQLIDPRSFDLTAASDELLAQMANHPIAVSYTHLTLPTKA